MPTILRFAFFFGVVAIAAQSVNLAADWQIRLLWGRYRNLKNMARDSEPWKAMRRWVKTYNYSERLRNWAGVVAVLLLVIFLAGRYYFHKF